MRHRITYIRDARHDDFGPDNIRVSGSSLDVRALQAAKEHRLTIGLSELPAEIKSVLEQSHELHIRWVSPDFHLVPSPFSSRVSPGLHVFLTPLENKDPDLMCPMLQNVFSESLKCYCHAESFTTPPLLSTRFSTTSSSQLYSYVPSLAKLVHYIQHQICHPSDQRCQGGAPSLLTASSVDIDYDVISRVLLLSVVWDKGPDEGSMWNEKTVKASDDDKVEVGILNVEPTTEPEELSFGGWLTVVGDDEKPKPTLFSFPSRHHIIPSNATQLAPTFDAAFDRPTGLHPTLRISIYDLEHLNPPSPSCALHAYLTLPSTLFIDRHAFSDPLFLSSHNLAALRSVSGATDLEAPDWAVAQWGSAALLQLSLARPPSPFVPTNAIGDEAVAREGDTATGKMTLAATVPLHARYLAPASGGHAEAIIPAPVVFWACAAEEGARFPVNPFDRKELGYDGLFGDRTLFYHLGPASGPRVSSSSLASGEALVSVLALPVLDLDKSGYIEVGTVAAVVAGFLWVCWMLFRPVTASARHESGSGRGEGHGKT